MTLEELDRRIKELQETEKMQNKLLGILKGTGSIVGHGSKLDIDASVSIRDLLNRIKALEYYFSSNLSEGDILKFSNGKLSSSQVIDDGSNVYIGAYSAGNYIQVESNGNLILHGDARIYRDELGDVTSLQVVGVGLSRNATEGTAEFTTGSNLSDYLYANVQLNHERDLTALLYPHLHGFQTTTGNPNYLLQYRYQGNGKIKATSWNNLACNTPAFTYASGTLNQLWYTSPITPPSDATLSDIIQFRVLRDNANTSTAFSGADPVAATVGLLSFDVHMVSNGFGSNEQLVK